MKVPQPAPKRVQYATGVCSLPFPAPDNRQHKVSMKSHILGNLALTRPFTKQIDIVFPLQGNETLQTELSQLSTVYRVRLWKLAEFIRFAMTADSSDVMAVSLPNPHNADTWCFQSKTLTLLLCKESYLELGLTRGDRLPWKEYNDMYLISMSHLALAQMTEKTRSLISAWDERTGPWNVAYFSPDAISDIEKSTTQIHSIEPSVRVMQNIYIPAPQITPRPVPNGTATDEVAEDWDEGVESLFEWVGMAALGAQRLHGHDKPDPYLAVYDFPEGSQLGDIVHVRWKGFIFTPFLRQVLEKFPQNLANSSFACITGQSILTSPITYASDAVKRRVPREDSEDTWSTVITKTEQTDGKKQLRWILGESVGKWDSRFG